MKLSIFITCFLLTGHLYAQTFAEEEGSEEELGLLLELPPVPVVTDDKSKEEFIEEDLAEALEALDDEPSEEEEDEVVEKGIQVQIEKIAGKPVNGDGSVKVDAPWPAKPISTPPTGWKFALAGKGVEPFLTKVTLSNGSDVELSITPYILEPLSDGLTSIKITEPGYQAGVGYDEENTLGIMLQNSTKEIENHEKQTAQAIERLQQLLSSLPRQTNE